MAPVFGGGDRPYPSVWRRYLFYGCSRCRQRGSDGGFSFTGLVARDRSRVGNRSVLGPPSGGKTRSRGVGLRGNPRWSDVCNRSFADWYCGA